MLNLNHLGLPFDGLGLTLGSLWLTFGSLLAHFWCSLAHFWCLGLTFGDPGPDFFGFGAPDVIFPSSFYNMDGIPVPKRAHAPSCITIVS